MYGSDCVTSSNYGDPNGYYSDQRCTIYAPVGSTISVKAFATEPEYDILRVNQKAYSGAGLGLNGVVLTSGTLSWSTDGSGTRSGWHICFVSRTCAGFFADRNTYWCPAAWRCSLTLSQQALVTTKKALVTSPVIGDEFYYNGSPTGVGRGDYGKACPDYLYCGAATTFGTTTEQTCAIKAAIDNGGRHPKAIFMPIPVPTPQPTPSPTSTSTITSTGISTGFSRCQTCLDMKCFFSEQRNYNGAGSNFCVSCRPLKEECKGQCPDAETSEECVIAVTATSASTSTTSIQVSESGPGKEHTRHASH
jgi:hypothetical protein